MDSTEHSSCLQPPLISISDFISFPLSVVAFFWLVPLGLAQILHSARLCSILFIFLFFLGLPMWVSLDWMGVSVRSTLCAPVWARRMTTHNWGFCSRFARRMIWFSHSRLEAFKGPVEGWMVKRYKTERVMTDGRRVASEDRMSDEWWLKWVLERALRQHKSFKRWVYSRA